MKKKSVAALSLIGIGIMIGVVIAFNSSFISNLFAKENIGASAPPIVLNEQVKALNNAFVAVSDAVLPTVVSISVEIEAKAGRNPFQEQFKDFFDFFGNPYGDQGGQEGEENKQKIQGSGSGVIISEDGFIVTNNHVVENALTIKVTTNDKKDHKAKLIGTDPLTDLAVIKIEGSGFPMVHFSDINNVRVGEMVLAVGNPLGLNSTITSGIISAIGRGGLSLIQDKDGYAIENFIQTDAAINPGNSGGGLFNLEGSLVGINTAIATRTGSYIGYGFAIPVDLVKKVVTDLIDYGKINRGYIGVKMRTVDEVVAKSVGLDKVEGAIVHDVIKDSPAQKAGIEAGDIILEINGKKVSTSNELQNIIMLKKANEEVDITIWRDGQKLIKKVKLEPRNSEELVDTAIPGEEQMPKDTKPLEFDKLGFSIEPITPEVKESFGVKSGVLVSRVKRYSIAEERGLAVKGVIVKADKEPITTPKDLKRVINSKKSGEAVLLQVKYKDSNRIVALEIPE